MKGTSMTVYLNGIYLDHADAVVSVDDRGFLFGDGVYEMTRAHNGLLFEGERHFRRLRRGLDGLAITLPHGTDLSTLSDVSERLLEENQLTSGDATVYLQITRGAAPRKHQCPPPGTTPTVFLSASRLVVPDDIRQRGAAAVTTADVRWGRWDLKTINLLPNVLAKQEAVARGAFEAILVRDGVLIEGSSSNLFAVLDGVIRTHPATNQILAGITREVVLEIAAELALPAAEEPIRVADLARVSELMVTATTADVMPIVQLDGKPVRDGRPGPVARQLNAALRARIERATARVPAR